MNKLNIARHRIEYLVILHTMLFCEIPNNMKNVCNKTNNRKNFKNDTKIGNRNNKNNR